MRCLGAGFNRNPAASGVRAAWCFGNLNNGGHGGVPCRGSSTWVSDAYWGGSLGATGTLKKYLKIIAPYNPRVLRK